MQRSFAVVVALFLPALGACPAAVDGGAGQANEGEGEANEGEGEGGVVPAGVDEVEPNDGAVVTDVDPIAVGERVGGALQVAGDIDLFRVETTPGLAYRVTLEVPAGSTLDGHLTVLDGGRGGDAAGLDYVRLGAGPAGGGALLDFFAMGQGGHIIAVRDARDLLGDAQGGPEATYVLTVSTLSVPTPTLAFPASIDGALPASSSVNLYAFDATTGSDVVIALDADGDLDARLFVYNAGDADWVARNDDGPDGADPLIDAPLFSGGPSLLVVEAVAEGASDLGYHLTTSGNGG